MSKKKLPPQFVKAPEGMLDSPLRPTGEAAIAAPADGFTHAVAARFSPEVGEALVVAAKAEGLTLDGLLRKVVADWLATRATRVEPVSAADAEVVSDARPRGLLEAVVERAMGTLARFGLRAPAMRLAGWLSPAR